MGLSLVEDLAAVVLMVLLPSLGELAPGRFVAIALALGKAALILIPFLLLVSRVIPPLLNQMARMRSAELFLLVALAIGLGTAALTQAVGLSLALGAFLAGLIISESDYAHETLARLLPLRDTFGALFFVTVGGLIDPRTVLDNLPVLAMLVLLIVVGKAVIRTGVVWLFGEPLPIAALVGVGLAQIGEFSFIVATTALTLDLMPAKGFQLVVAASIISITLNPPLFAMIRPVEGWAARKREAAGVQ
jgi:CPA2 family monovalent cation:H+ antiporter-2